MTIDLRLGRWQDVGVVACDLLCTDPPYSPRTHEGQSESRNDGGVVTDIGYASWTAADVDEFVDAWSPVVRGWVACMTDSELAPAYRAAYERNGRYCFAPVPCVIRGMTVRMLGDGPSSWCVWLMVARPRTREAASWGTLPGAYTGPSEECYVTGGKPEWLVSAIVRDYSRPGNLVVDPCAGGGTTLVCADALGRDAIGMEMSAKTYAVAKERLSRGVQLDLSQGAM